MPGLVQLDRVAHVEKRAHNGFNIDYIGTTNSGKLDPKVFSIISNLNIPDVRFRIYGGALEPAMAQAHAAMPDPSRVEICGFTENIAEVFATTDVFAFPMAESSYGAGDLALQEAMFAGLPVVVYADRGSSHLVQNGESGLVVPNAAGFTAAIERLYRDLRLRSALGAAAKSYAQAEFGSGKLAGHLARMIEHAAATPKRPLYIKRPTSIDLGQLTPAALFLVSQGWSEEEAADAVAAWVAGNDNRLSDFAQSASNICFTIEGGIVQWRNHEPNDSLLRVWSGHWLQRSGRDREARSEFDVALRLGANAGAVARLAQRSTGRSWSERIRSD